MNRINAARVRLEHATGLPAILDAAYDAFEDMLGVVEDQQDPGSGAFAAFVMAGAAAANGRNAVAAAPSLPPPSCGDTAGTSGGLSAEAAAALLAALSQLLITRLTRASAQAAGLGDRVACAQAARHAASICSLLGGVPVL